MNKKLSSLVVIIMFIWSLIPGSVGGVEPKEHDATVTLSPDVANCDPLPTEFTVNIENTGGAGSYGIYNVKIYKAQTNIVDLTCGPAPTGWTFNGFKFDTYCEYETDPLGLYVIENGENVDFTFDAIINQTDCVSTFRVTTLDNEAIVTGSGEGEEENHYKNLEVDCTDPLIHKVLDDSNTPSIDADGTGIGVCPPSDQNPGDVCWITKNTEIDVHADDNALCDLGVDYCEFSYTVDGSPGPSWNVDDTDGEVFETIKFDEDSVHVLTITCVDEAGNSVTDVETFKVDTVPPETDKTYGTPSYPPNINDPAPYPHWITTSTPITLTYEDGGDICAIGVDDTYYLDLVVPDEYCELGGCTAPVCIYPAPYQATELGVEATGECGPTGQNPCECALEWELYTVPFTKDEESCHIIQYFSVDELENLEVMQWQCVFVDDTPPEGTKDVGDPKYGDCPELPEFCDGWGCLDGIEKDFFVTGRYGDNNPTAGAWELAIWEVDGGETVVAEDNYGFSSGVEVDFSLSYDPSDGKITYTLDGKTLEYTYDSGKAFDYIIPFAKGDANGNSVDLTEMQINGKSISDLSSGTGYKGLKVHLTDTEQVNGFTITGKAELTWGGSPANEKPAFHVFAMNTHDLDPDDCWVQDHTTAITLTCVDPQPHPVDQEEVCYKVSLDYADVTCSYCPEALDNGWCCVDDSAQIIFVEDSLHDLEYFCRDALGNANAVDLEYFRVDSQPPIITKTMIGTDHLGQCPPVNPGDECYVRDDGVNGVRIDVADDDTYGCAVDEVVCTYELWWEDDTNDPVSSGSFGEEGVDVIFTEDSTHTLIIHCEDALGNSVDDEEEFLVDSTPPETEKEYGQPQKVDPDCYDMCVSQCIELDALPPPDPDCLEACIHEMCTWWITSQTPITLTADDEKVGVDKTYWRNTIVPDAYCWDQQLCGTDNVFSENMDGWNEYDGPFYKPDESCHMIEYFSVDLLGNAEMPKVQCVFVDNTAPMGIKEIGDPNIPCSTTTTTLPPTTTTIPPTTTTVPPTTTTIPPTTTTTSSTTTTTIIGEVCVGTPNQDETTCNNYSPDQCADLSSVGCYWCTQTTMCWGFPTMSCSALQALGESLGYPDKCSETPGCSWQPVVFTAEDREEGDVYDGVAVEGVGDGPCAGATQTEQCAYVASNNLPPFAYDSLTAPGIGADPALLAGGCGDILILSSGNPMETSTNYISTNMGHPGCGDGSETNPDGQPTYDCVDVVFTPAADSIVVAVSSEWPEYYESITDWMRIGGILDQSINDWEPDVNPDDGWPDTPYQNTVVIPYGPSSSGVIKLAVLSSLQQAELRIADSIDYIYDTAMIVAPKECFEDIGPVLLCGNGDIDPGEECEFDADCAQGEVCETCLCVEEGEPEEPGCDYWVRDHVTEITLDCVDQGPHPVEQETLCYRVSFDDPQTPWLTSQYCSQFGGTMEGDWCCEYVGDYCEPYTITFQEDSLHDLEFYCMDHLGNENEKDKEWFKVDSTAPTTEKIITPDAYFDGLVEYIDTAHEITLTATDGGPICAVGVDKIYWANSIVSDEACLNPGESCNPVETCYNEVEGNSVVIQKVDESCHLLQYYAVDELGNTEEVQTNCFFVDKQKPVTSKVYGDPFFEENGVEWVTSETDVNLSAYDPDPHPSGVAETWYRDVYLEDEVDWHYCYEDCEEWENDERYSAYGLPTAPEPYNPSSLAGWLPWTGEPFHKEPESCHIIEFYSFDNVGKVEKPKWQCVLVDNSPPDPIKTVGDPKTKWDGTDSTFYPEETAHCWDGTEDQIECWKVTLDTPITLDCIDPEPHPVDHEITCFMVGLDGDDATAEYCSEVGGNYNASGDGYCCGQNAPFEFYFMEETEHNLKYYCEDALGNKGPVDEEKFKVFGESFEIQINKKWNLVSVPFVLLNSDIEEVFDSISENIATVWTYDAASDQWYVYRPGEPNNNLEEINTGWGYWIEALENDWLLIGGDLFMPAVLPPNRELKEGWNLIGYYGTEGQMGYYGPDGNGKPAYCALYTLVGTNLVPKWSSLLTYWEPDNPEQWKEYGIILDNNLDPGAGYWIHLKEDGDYAPSTACVPIFD